MVFQPNIFYTQKRLFLGTILSRDPWSNDWFLQDNKNSALCLKKWYPTQCGLFTCTNPIRIGCFLRIFPKQIVPANELISRMLKYRTPIPNSWEWDFGRRKVLFWTSGVQKWLQSLDILCVQILSIKSFPPVPPPKSSL